MNKNSIWERIRKACDQAGISSGYFNKMKSTNYVPKTAAWDMHCAAIKAGEPIPTKVLEPLTNKNPAPTGE